MHKNRSIPLLGLFEIFGLLTIVASLLSLLSAQHRLFELISHFKWQYFIGSWIFLAAFVYLRRNWWIIALSVCALLNTAVVIPWYIPSTNHVTQPDSLKLIQFNLLSSNTEYAAVLNFVKQENPDVFIAQEVSHAWQTQLEQLSVEYPYRHMIPRYDNFGLAILSKLPLTSIEDKDWNESKLPSLLVNLMFSETSISLAISHLPPPGGMILYYERNAQAKAMLAEMLTHNQPSILVGDYNMTMWSSDYQIFTAENKFENVRQGFGILATWPAALSVLGIPIDHILVSQEFFVVDAYTGPNIGSDHLPLVAILQLANKKP